VWQLPQLLRNSGAPAGWPKIPGGGVCAIAYDAIATAITGKDLNEFDMIPISIKESYPARCKTDVSPY
jgi:hypothetical protein